MASTSKTTPLRVPEISVKLITNNMQRLGIGRAARSQKTQKFCSGSNGIDTGTKLYLNNDLLEKKKVLEAKHSILLVELNNLLEVETLDTQVSCAKCIADTINMNNIPDEIRTYYIQCFCYLFFNLKGTNFKSFICCVLCGFCDRFQSEVIQNMNNEIISRISEAQVFQNTNIFHERIMEISFCFDYFTAAELIFHSCISECMEFLQIGIKTLINEFRRESSPLERNESLQFCHNTVRTLIVILQRCRVIVEERTSDELCNRSLVYLLHNISTLIKDHLVPMELKGNCGLSLIMILQIQGQHWTECLPLVQNTTEVLNSNTPFWGNLKSLDTSIQISITSALLSVLPDKELVQCYDEVFLINSIFCTFRDLTQNLVNSMLVLGCSRGMMVWSQKIVSLVTNSTYKTVLYKVISTTFYSCLDCIWSWLEHYMETVRHTGRKILENLLTVLWKIKADEEYVDFVSEFVNNLAKYILSMSTHQKSKYIGMSCMAEKFGTRLFLKLCPAIPEQLASSLTDFTIACYIGETFHILMMKHKQEEDTSVWQKIWLEPLLKALGGSTNTGRVMEGILLKALKLDPTILQVLLAKKGGSVSLPPEHVKALVMCLKMGRKQGFEADHSTNEESNNLWKGMVDKSFLKSLLVTDDDEVRAAGFSIIVDSHKTTEIFSKEDLNMLLECMPYSFNIPCSNFRQLLMTVVKNMLSRLKASGEVIYRMSQKLGEYSDTLSSYSDFLFSFCQIQFNSLYCGSNFSRRGLALQILTLVQSIFHFKTIEPFNFTPILTTKNAHILFDCLVDSYEDYKAMALELLTYFDVELLQLTNEEVVSSLLSACFRLASSAKPPESITASYLLRFLMRSPVIVCILEDLINNDLRNLSTELPEEKYFWILSILVNKVIQEKTVAELNICTAASQGPMYGLLLCIRSIFQDIDILKLVSSEEWRTLIASLIILCYEMNAIVCSVVSSSSPEGHLPMDFDTDVSKLNIVHKNCIDSDSNTNGKLPVTIPIETVTTHTVTAQLLLLCSWRTMKEVCLLLGEMCYNFPIGDNKEIGEYLLTISQVTGIGEHFINLTSQTKHRGAFEQAYIGFSKVCNMLWRSKLSSLHILPRMWLDDLLASIQGHGTKSVYVCATRRSAGVPYTIQALISSELEVQTSQCLTMTVDLLLHLAKQTPETGEEEPRIHAMNILRALFRDARLSEAVAPYVSEGMESALFGFKGKTWSERNSATLLYSALMTRMFGVKRTRDELSKKNQMTGHVFFQRYPSLYVICLNELQCATSTMEQSSITLHPSLYPVLMLLARLYPSPSQPDTTLEISAFIPYVLKCGDNGVYKTRMLSAKALIPLIFPDQQMYMLESLFKKLGKAHDLPENSLHGTLLHIFYLIKEVNSGSNFKTEDVTHWITCTLWLLKKSCVIREAYVQVLERIIVGHSFNISEETRYNMKLCVTSCLQEKSSNSIGEALHHRAMASFALTLAERYYLNVSETFVNIWIICVQHQDYEVKLLALDCVLSACEVEIESGMPEKSYTCFEFNQTSKEQIKSILQENSYIASILGQMIGNDTDNRECAKKVFLAMSFCINSLCVAWRFVENDLSKKLVYLLDLCNDEELGPVVLSVAVHIVLQILDKRMYTNSLSTFCDMIFSFSMPDKSIECRNTAAEVLIKLQPHFIVSKNNLFLPSEICNLWTSVFLLLQDDEPDLRHSASSLANEWNEKSPYEIGIPVPLKALDLLLQHIISSFGKTEPSYCLSLLLSWSLWDEDQTFERIDDEDRVFDKGEINTYIEEVTSNCLVVKHLKILLNDQFQKNMDSGNIHITVDLQQCCLPDAPFTNTLDSTNFTLMHFINELADSITKMVDDVPVLSYDTVFVSRWYNHFCKQLFKRWNLYHAFHSCGIVGTDYITDSVLAKCSNIPVFDNSALFDNTKLS